MSFLRRLHIALELANNKRQKDTKKYSGWESFSSLLYAAE